MLLHITLIFILLTLGILLTNKNTKLGKKTYLFMVFLVLFALSAFRSANIGNDTKDYILMFNKFGQTNNIFQLNTYIEIGYVLLNKILFTINQDPIILMIVTSIFIIGVFTIFIYKYSNMVWLSIFLFINLRIYYFTLSGIRQSIAIAIILISYKYIKERKFIPFLILVLIASTFHITALIFLLIYPLSKLKYSRKLMVLQMLLAGGIFLTFDSFINLAFKIFPKYQVYLNSSYFESIKLASIIDFFVILFIYIFGILIKEKTSKAYLKNNDETTFVTSIITNEKNLLLHIMSLAVMFNFIAIKVSLIKRIGMYFSVYAIIFIPLVIGNIKNKHLKILAIYIIIIFVFAYNIIILIYRPEWQHVYPYQFIWS